MIGTSSISVEIINSLKLSLVVSSQLLAARYVAFRELWHSSARPNKRTETTWPLIRMSPASTFHDHRSDNGYVSFFVFLYLASALCITSATSCAFGRSLGSNLRHISTAFRVARSKGCVLLPIAASVIFHIVPFVTVSCTSLPLKSGKCFFPVSKKLRMYPRENVSAFSDLGLSPSNCSGACHCCINQ